MLGKRDSLGLEGGEKAMSGDDSDDARCSSSSPKRERMDVSSPYSPSHQKLPDELGTDEFVNVTDVSDGEGQSELRRTAMPATPLTPLTIDGAVSFSDSQPCHSGRPQITASAQNNQEEGPLDLSLKPKRASLLSAPKDQSRAAKRSSSFNTSSARPTVILSSKESTSPPSSSSLGSSRNYNLSPSDQDVEEHFRRSLEVVASRLRRHEIDVDGARKRRAIDQVSSSARTPLEFPLPATTLAAMTVNAGIYGNTSPLPATTTDAEIDEHFARALGNERWSQIKNA